MSLKERRATIAERLRTDGEASIAELAACFGTSEMTIRRDLELLEEEGLARRVRGGAITIRSRSYEPPILQRSALMAGAKRRIGAAAAALVKENETIVLDVGTTALEMAKALADMPVTVITSSLLIATELDTKPAVRTIVTGGVVRHGEMSLIGSRAQAAYDDLNCDTVYVGVAGVSHERGLTEYNMDDAAVKRAALGTGRRVVVLADSTKLGQVALVTVAPIEVVDLLITDATPDDPVIRSIRARGVQVLHVELSTKEIH